MPLRHSLNRSQDRPPTLLASMPKHPSTLLCLNTYAHVARGAAGAHEAAKNQNFSPNLDIFVQISTFRRDAPQTPVKIGEFRPPPQIFAAKNIDRTLVRGSLENIRESEQNFRGR
jgi:hypothetical protein